MDELELRAKAESTDLTPEASADTMSALDSLAAAETGQTPDAGETPGADETITPKPDAKPAAAATPAAEAPKPGAENTPAPEADPLDAIQLPPHTKPKSAEAFETLKKAAKEAQANLRKQLEETTGTRAKLEQELNDLRGKVGVVPEEVKTELEELRKFRLSHDVTSDPTFKEFDTKVANNVEAVWKKLEGAGISAEQVKRMKEIGFDQLDWDPILPKLPVAMRRFVEATLVENVKLSDEKALALEKAKANAQGFMKERTEREVKTLTETANKFLANLPWTALKQVPANATPEQRAEIEAANTLAQQTQARMKEFLSDRSPARHAELAVGTALAYKFKGELDGVLAQLDKVTKEKDTALKTITEERDKLKAELEAIRRAEDPRPGGEHVRPTTAVSKASVHVDASTALEELYKQQLSQGAAD
ncbi:MAG TPA: hypothetical protein VEH04_16845 [Verrucomicrobiae bacterium]|nr:hypothetical protein [Verrucomicrobiae bacterium]